MNATQQKKPLSKINPTLAGKILVEMNRSNLAEETETTILTPTVTEGDMKSFGRTTVIGGAPPTITTISFADYKKLVGEKLRNYKIAVDDKLNEVRNMAYINLAFIGATAVFLVLALIFSNLASAVGAVGLGSTSVLAQATTWKDTLGTYVKDSGNLRRHIAQLNGDFDGSKDEDDLKAIEQQIKDDYTQLQNAQAKPKTP